MKNNRTNILFYIGYILLILTDMCSGFSIIERYDNIINAIAYAFLAAFVVLSLAYPKNINKKQLLLYGLIAVVFIVSTVISKNAILIRFVLLAMSARLMDFGSYISKDAFIKTIITIVLIAMPLLGYTANNIVLRSDMRARYGFGFSHPNTLSCYLMFIIMSVYYIAHVKKKYLTKLIIKTTIIPAAIAFMALVTDSRGAIVGLIIFWIAIVFRKVTKKILNNKIIKGIIRNQFLLYLLVSVLMLFLYRLDNPFAINLDQALSHRLDFYNTFLDNSSSFLLFGDNIPININDVGGQLIPLDSMYLKMIMNQGIIVTVFFVAYFRKTFKMTYKRHDWMATIILSIACMEGILETNMMLPTLNVFMMYLSFNIDKTQYPERQLITKNYNIMKAVA